MPASISSAVRDERNRCNEVVAVLGIPACNVSIVLNEAQARCIQKLPPRFPSHFGIAASSLSQWNVDRNLENSLT